MSSKYANLSATENSALDTVAADLGVSADSLYKLINFESGWNPAARNPITGATGLIQWENATARDLGYNDAADLLSQNPDRVSQLNVVYQYLAPYKPFANDQSLTMAVFYPAYRNVSPDTQFPADVQRDNPDIKTPLDYMQFVFGKNYIPPLAIAAGIAIIVIAAILSRKGV